MQKPLVLIVSGAGSILGGTQSGTGVNFGPIALIYETSDSFSINDTVMYATKGQELVVYDGIEYAIIREENILYKEVPLP